MLAVLDQHCCPGTAVNAFMTPVSLFNDSQDKNEPIMEFCSWFDSLVMDMLRCKIMLLLILLMMFFLSTVRGCYADLFNQFCSHFKVLETAIIDSFVEDVRYHNIFTLAGSKKSPPPSRCRVPKASADYVDK